MNNNVLTILKKELARFFGDKRMVITTILLPGLMIYMMYTFMGDFMMKELLPDEDYVADSYVVNMPQELSEALKQLPLDWKEIPEGTTEDDIRTQIQEKEVDALIVFPEDFVAKVANYDVNSGEAAPNVEIYYNSAETESQKAMLVVSNVMDEYEASMANKLDVNEGETTYDLATEKDTTAQLLSMMMPMLLMIFMYSGCIAVAPESIAGEKERGTIATMLVTPMKRSALALGKILALSCIALLSGVSSFAGTLLSLPKMMGGDALGVNTFVYSAKDYILLLGIILSTVLAMVAVISIISALAKSVKEAGTMVSPLMVVVMLLSLSPMFLGDVKPFGLFFVPILNSALCIHSIFSFTFEPLQVIVTIVTNVLATAVMTYVLKRMFDSENIMFAR